MPIREQLFRQRSFSVPPAIALAIIAYWCTIGPALLIGLAVIVPIASVPPTAATIGLPLITLGLPGLVAFVCVRKRRLARRTHLTRRQIGVRMGLVAVGMLVTAAIMPLLFMMVGSYVRILRGHRGPDDGELFEEGMYGFIVGSPLALLLGIVVVVLTPRALAARTPHTSRCAKCGYDLRYRPSGGLCPECGASVVG